MAGLDQFLRDKAVGDLLPWVAQAAAAETFALSCHDVEAAALALGLLPARYQRNRTTISVEQQRVLFDACVAVIGCGGLGGYVIEQLARLGVGTIIVQDPDRFEEHNLNRQLLSEITALGRPKVELAAERVARINPAVTLVAIHAAYAPEQDAPLAGVQVVVDALDSIAIRLALGDSCERLGLPLVHGAIAGWYGQVITAFPGDRILHRMYPQTGNGKGAEQHLGNPSFTPAVVASLETAEVCKILLGVGQPLRSRMLSVNLLDMDFEQLCLEP